MVKSPNPARSLLLLILTINKVKVPCPIPFRIAFHSGTLCADVFIEQIALSSMEDGILGKKCSPSQMS